MRRSGCLGLNVMDARPAIDQKPITILKSNLKQDFFSLPLVFFGRHSKFSSGSFYSIEAMKTIGSHLTENRSLGRHLKDDGVFAEHYSKLNSFFG